MLKYTTAQVTFREIPDEVTLCINISGCLIRCPDCHSKELWEDIGIELTSEEFNRLIEENKGITCVCLIGGDSDKWYIRDLIMHFRQIYSDLKFAWYSGCSEFSPVMMSELDYYKYGPYIKELGGLDFPTTNQKLYMINLITGNVKNITYKFWNNEQNGNS